MNVVPGTRPSASVTTRFGRTFGSVAPYAFALSVVLLSACARAPVTEELTIEPARDGDLVRVTVTTSFTLRPANERVEARVQAARSAALAGTDPWGLRFSRLTPVDEEVSYARSRDVLERVTRTARIPADDLQRLFSDTTITVDVLRGEGWRELTFYPGSSTRATREQLRHFELELSQWGESVARYFSAVDALYAYLRKHPGRDRFLFAAWLDEKGPDGSPAVVREEEQHLVDAVRTAMEAIAARMDRDEGHAATFAEEADLIYNPFPARVTVRPPHNVLSSEGFSAGKDGALTIEPVDLFAAIAGLEGRWITPDPLAALLREEEVTAAQLAGVPRRSESIVSSGSVTSAIREQLAPPGRYSVRWRSTD